MGGLLLTGGRTEPHSQIFAPSGKWACIMIMVSRLNGKTFYINEDLIEFIEETPDTVLTLTTGKKLVVEEGIQLIIDRIIEFRQLSVGSLPKVVARE